MKTLGYEHIGDLGIKNREAFRPKSEQSPEDGKGTIWQRHNVYACVEGVVSLQNHLLFRDYLRAHSGEAKEYGELKKRLAKEFEFDADTYLEKKTPFITQILKRVGFELKDIEDIAEQNRAK